MTDLSAITPASTTTVSILHPHWELIAVRGVLFVIAGIAAVALPFTATLATELLIGWLFVFAGFFRFVALLGARRMPGFFQSLFLDVVMIGLGAVFILHPLGGELTLTMLVAAFFVFEAFHRFLRRGSFPSPCRKRSLAGAQRHRQPGHRGISSTWDGP